MSDGSHKLCRDCGVTKRRNEFSLRNYEKGYLSPYCKPCVVQRTLAWTQEHRQARNAYIREYQTRPHVRAQKSAYKRRRYASDPAYRAARRDELRRYRHKRAAQCAGGNHGTLLYPYLLDSTLDGADLLLHINALVPRRLPEAIRADVCQEMALAVLSGESALDELRERISLYVRHQWEMVASRHRYVFLDSLSARSMEYVEVYARRLVEAWGQSAV